MFKAVLDQAIAKVAAREFGLISEGMAEREWSDKVHQSLNSLGGLQLSNPPDYSDPWIALFCMTWYQPRQVQLVRSLVEEQRIAKNSEHLLRSDRRILNVIDVGCGALALRFGLVLAVADALELGEGIDEIHIDSIDPNTSMAELGVKIWNEFLSQVLADRTHGPSLKSLIAAIRTLSHPVPTVRNIKLKELRVDPEAEFWLSAIHAVYPNNVEDINSSLVYLVSTNKPDVGFLTGHDHVGQDALLQKASPFENSQFVRRMATLDPKFGGFLPEVTRWRRLLNDKMISRHRYLDRDVGWSFPKSLAWTYTKADC